MGKNLITIKEANKIIFVGDTHGDLEVSQKIIKKYLKNENKIVFLGDYVDRGPFSKENVEFLLKTKEKFPEKIFLLQGNHEGYHTLKFSPAEFWEGLSEIEYKKFSEIFRNMPLAVVTKDIIALHGALPEVENVEDIEKIKIGDTNWFYICWGDFYEKDGGFLGNNNFNGRPSFGIDYFEKIMKKLKKKILIRSHQPNVPFYMFNYRCLNIFTSSVYKNSNFKKERIIAVLDCKKPIKNAKDLKIIKV